MRIELEKDARLLAMQIGHKLVEIVLTQLELFVENAIDEVYGGLEVFVLHLFNAKHELGIQVLAEKHLKKYVKCGLEVVVCEHDLVDFGCLLRGGSGGSGAEGRGGRFHVVSGVFFDGQLVFFVWCGLLSRCCGIWVFFCGRFRLGRTSVGCLLLLMLHKQELGVDAVVLRLVLAEHAHDCVVVLGFAFFFDSH